MIWREIICKLPCIYLIAAQLDSFMWLSVQTCRHFSTHFLQHLQSTIIHFKCHSPFLFLSLFNAVTTNSSWMITTDTCTTYFTLFFRFSQVILYCFCCSNLAFLHRRLISPSNGYLFPMLPGGRSSWSDLSKTFSILCITAVPNPFIWQLSMKGFVSWLVRLQEYLKVFFFYIKQIF